MSLGNASISQLVKWQTEIIVELAKRAQANAAPAAPWDNEPAHEPPPPPRQPTEVELLEARLAQLRAGGTLNTPGPRGPAMLGGQVRPGMVLATERTDPKAAAVFMQTAPRPRDDAPPVQGNGRGEGMIGFSGGNE